MGNSGRFGGRDLSQRATAVSSQHSFLGQRRQSFHTFQGSNWRSMGEGKNHPRFARPRFLGQRPDQRAAQAGPAEAG